MYAHMHRRLRTEGGRKREREMQTLSQRESYLSEEEKKKNKQTTENNPTALDEASPN